MIKVMVCGARDGSDVDFLVEAGVDAVGLITEVKQDIPCNLRRQEARDLARRVPPMVSSVLIVTEDSADEVCRMVELVRPDAVQLHGFNPPEVTAAVSARVSIKVIKTLHMEGSKPRSGADTETIAKEHLEAGARAILLDSYRSGKVGATGRTVDFGAARKLRDAVHPKPIILAGGLRSSNVAAALSAVKPFAVDVFSGVNLDGRICQPAVHEFMRTVRGHKCEGDGEIGA